VTPAFRDWNECHLSDLVSVQHGFAFKGEFFGQSGPYVLVTPGNFFDAGGFKRNGEKQKRYDGPVSPEFILPPGSLIVAMTEQAEGLLGSGAIVPNDDTYLHNQRIGLVRSKNADTKFLFYLFNAPTVRRQIRATSSGTKVRHTSPSRIGETKVVIPRVEVQRRIADILSAYDDLTEVNQRRIVILKEAARRLFDEWFVRFRYPGHETTELVETELGRAPQGWDIIKARAAFNYLGGGTPSKADETYWESGTIDWYTPTDLTRSGRLFVDQSQARITELGLSRSSARLFPAFSVMMTSRATLGVFAINTAPATTNQGFTTFLPSERSPLYFLYHLLKHELPRMETVSSGATFKEITKGALGDLDFLIPPKALVRQFEQLIAPLMEQVLVCSRQNTRLRAARDLLLPKLISGEIEVGRAEAAWPEAAE
jgi:type I restriction enzyme, S subunit